MKAFIHNPAHSRPDEFSATFSGRENEYKALYQLLTKNSETRQHAIIIGPRGIGKTTLGLKLCIEIREKPTLSERWTAIQFFEESYGITSLADFWLTALRHLSDSTGDPNWERKAKELSSSTSSEDELSVRALSTLLEYCSSTSKSVLLFVENIDEIFAQLKDRKHDLHRLRETLIKRSELCLVGTAAKVFGAIKDRREPLYGFFKLIILKPLNGSETRVFFEALSSAYHDDVVKNIVHSDPGRIEVIRRLTGGTPRWLTLAYRLLVETPSGKVREDIEHLIDDQTPYFKAQIESLSPQLRKAFHVLAAHWSPMLAKELASELRISSSHASALLTNLRDLGFVEEIKGKKRGRAQYQVRERFYNIYYISRFTRDKREQLEALIRFIYQLFGPSGLEQVFRAALSRLRTAVELDADETNAFPIYAQFIANEEELKDREALWSEALEVCSLKQVALNEMLRLTPQVLECGPSDFSSMIKYALNFPNLDTDLLVQYALVANEKGRRADADTFFARAAELRPNESDTWHRLGLAYEEIADFDQAIAAFTKLAELKPTMHSYTHLAFVYTSAKRSSDAGSAGESALESGSDSASDWAYLGAAFARMGDRRKAHLCVDRAEALKPRGERTWYDIAYAYYQGRNYHKCIQALRQGLIFNPDSSRLWSRFSIILRGVRTDSVLSEIIDTSKYFLSQNGNNRRALNTLALCEMSQQRFSDAEKTLRRALASDNDDYATWFNLGLLNLDQDNFREAIQPLKRALEIAPTNGDVLHALGAALEKSGELHEAEQVFKKFIKAHERRPHGWLHLAAIFQKQKRFNESEIAFRTAIDLDEKYVPAIVGLGSLYEDVGRFDEAMRMAHNATTKRPKFFLAWILLARCATRLGHYSDARDAMEKAIALGETDPEDLVLIGRHLSQIPGEEEHAVEYARQVLAKDPNSASVTEAAIETIGQAGRWSEALARVKSWAKKHADLWKNEGANHFLDLLIRATKAQMARDVRTLLEEVPSESFLPLTLALKKLAIEEIPRQPQEVNEAVDEILSRIGKPL